MVYVLVFHIQMYCQECICGTIIVITKTIANDLHIYYYPHTCTNQCNKYWYIIEHC